MGRVIHIEKDAHPCQLARKHKLKQLNASFHPSGWKQKTRSWKYSRVGQNTIWDAHVLSMEMQNF